MTSECSTQTFSYSDGTPDTAENSIGPCVYVDGLGDGFQFTVAADTTARILRVYLGADYGTVKLYAFLSDGSAAPIIDVSLSNPDAATPSVYTINFHAASAGQRLTLRFTLSQQYDWGDINLYAATLSGTSVAGLPTISSLSPSSGAVGTLVTVSGSGFGSTQGSSTITLNENPLVPTSWSNTRITFVVPNGAATGSVALSVAGLISNVKTFTVKPTPTITSVSPTVAAVGMPVTITGTNFGSSQGSSTVKFNGTTATPTSWSVTQIVVTVPGGANIGNVVVHTSGVDTNGVLFTVATIASIAVAPPNLSLPSNSVQRFFATITYSNDVTQDASNLVAWTSSDTTVAPIDNQGVVISTGQGTTVIQASYGSLTAQTTLTITGKHSFTQAGNLYEPRWAHTATLLADGRVLIAGGGNTNNALSSTELYDPVTKTFSPGTPMHLPRMLHTATALQDGRVLIAGGECPIPWAPDYLSDCSFDEVYDPSTGVFAQLPGVVHDWTHTATLLNTGNVLIVGPWPPEQLFDTSTGLYVSTGNTLVQRDTATATLLNDGTVLVAGGRSNQSLASAELFHPTTGTFVATGSLSTSSYNHTATLLNDGRVLIAGGYNYTGNTNTSTDLVRAELYDPGAQTFSVSRSLAVARSGHLAIKLFDGTVLLIGGEYPTDPATAEIFDPSTQMFIGAGALVNAIGPATATLLNDGTILVIDGDLNAGSAELYGASVTVPQSVQITPSVDHFQTGGAQNFVAVDNLGQRRYDATWTISDFNVATITASSTPTLTAVTPGQATLSVNVEGVVAQLQITVAPHSVQVTPATATISVGDTKQFNAVDELGRPMSVATWTVSDPGLASITTDSSPTLTSLGAGTLTLTAHVEGVTSQAQVTIFAAGTIPTGTATWSVPNVPGFVATQIAQAVPTDSGPDLYSIQSSSDARHSVVQALTADGRQMWQKSLPILNGNSVPDGSGGLIVTENNTCFPGQTDPMTIVDLDGAGGQQKWTRCGWCSEWIADSVLLSRPGEKHQRAADCS